MSEPVRFETLHENPWLSLKKIIAPDKGVQGYVYSYETRCGGHIIAVLPYRKNSRGVWEFLLRLEVTPCWGWEFEPSAITGGCELPISDVSIVEDARRELMEESGFSVPRLIPGELTGDGSELEKQASCIWVRWPYVCNDPIVSIMYGRLMFRLERKP